MVLLFHVFNILFITLIGFKVEHLNCLRLLLNQNCYYYGFLKLASFISNSDGKVTGASCDLNSPCDKESNLECVGEDDSVCKCKETYYEDKHGNCLNSIPTGTMQ